jgi:spore germination cell wall hydrolase CwlJ-like protein
MLIAMPVDIPSQPIDKLAEYEAIFGKADNPQEVRQNLRSLKVSSIYKGVNEDQMIKLVATVVAEGLGEGVEGMKAIINVIENRAQKNGEYWGAGLPNVWGVLTKPAQFSSFNTSNPIYRRVRDYMRGTRTWLPEAEIKAIKEVQKMIELSQQGKLDDITNGANMYYNPKTAKKFNWQDMMQNKKQIGNHVFGYIER